MDQLKEIALIVELLLAVLIMSLQVKYFYSTRNHIRILARLFPRKRGQETPYKIKKEIADNGYKIEEYNRIEVNEKDDNITEHFRNIVDATNKYLIGNIGAAADFNILKNISERISEAEENAINSRISLPLFIGLMGTFVGVILGIISIYLSTGNSGPDSSGTLINDDSIRKFLGGVFIAMTASFVGLFLTTISNSFIFKEAKAERDANKNDYFNFLQAELLPILNRDLSDRLKSLEGTLQKFSNEFSGKLFENLDAFNTKFEENNKKFGENTTLVVDNLKLQKEFLDKLGKQKVEKIISANVEIFNKIDSNKEFFNKLFDFTDRLNTVLGKSINASEKLENLISKVTGFEENIKLLTHDFTRNELVIQKYIGDVLERSEQLKKRYELIISHINTVDGENSAFISSEKEAISKLTNTSLNELEEISSQLQKSISTLDKDIKEKMTRSFNFSEEKKQFRDLLTSVQAEINGLATALKEEGHSVVETHKETMTKFTAESLESYRNSLGAVNSTLQNIEQLFNKITSEKPKTGSGPTSPPPSPHESIWKKIKKRIGISR